MGLHQAVALCMYHCHATELTGDGAWFKTVVYQGELHVLQDLQAESAFSSLYHSFCFHFELID